jgi:hypothetical protein
MNEDNTQGGAEPSPASIELTSRLAEIIGADPALTQSIRIDVNVHRSPTVTVTRLVDADQVGRIIKMSTWSDFTLVKKDELKRLRKGTAITDDEREAVERAVAFCECTNAPLPTSNQIATLRGLLERTKEVSDE